MPHEFEPVWRGNHARPGDALYLFSTTQRLSSISLPAGWVASNPTRYTDQDWYKTWVQKILLPPDVAAGEYSISWHCPDPAADFQTTVRVLPAPSEPQTFTVGPNYSAASLNALINQYGARRIKFLPGTYYWETNLYCADPAADVYLEGERGLVVFRRRLSGEYGQRMIALNKGLGTIHCRGISFRGLGFDTLVYHGWPGDVRRLDVIDCDLEDCQLLQFPAIDEGANLSSILLQRVRFGDGSGTGVLPAGTVLNWCEFFGRTLASQHAYFNGYGMDRILCMNTDWRGTNRGPVSQGVGGQGCLFVACKLTDINKGQVNGGECFLWEPNGSRETSYNAVVSCHVTNSTGPGISLYGKGISRNRFDDLTLGTRGTSIDVDTLGNDGLPNEENVFGGIECDGEVCFTGNSGKNRLNMVIARDLPVSSGNQQAFNGQAGSPQHYRSGRPFTDASNTQDNVFSNCSVATPAGLLAVSREPGGPIKVEEVPAQRV